MATKEEPSGRGRAEVKRIVLYITCACGRTFASEDLEPECPYCGRKYEARVVGDPWGFRVSLTLIGEAGRAELGSEDAEQRPKPRIDPIEP